MILDESLLALACQILGAWAVLTGAEWVVDASRWADGGPLGRDLHRWRQSRWWQWPIFDVLHSATGLGIFGAMRALFGFWLLLGPEYSLPPLAGLGLVCIAQALRGVGDGADKFALVVIAGCLMQTLGMRLELSLLTFAGTLWIGGQLTLAYATSGFAKLRHAVWRNGEAIQAALSSHANGSAWTARLLTVKGRARLLAWAVILPEALFPLALLLPAIWLAAILALFLIFHLMIAAAMGINSYPLAFAAGYPATLMLGQSIRMQLGIS